MTDTADDSAAEDAPEHVVTAFLRRDERILLCRRRADADADPGLWDAVSGPAGDDPDRRVREGIAAETGIDATAVRSGGTVPVAEGEQVVHPYLFDTHEGEVSPGETYDDCEWVHPTAILDRDCVPDLWACYERVAPTVRTIAADDEHGASALSVRALAVLRDRAGRVESEVETGGPDAEVAWEELADLARRLRQARPSMAVLRTRINRVLHEAEHTPAAVEARAREAVEAGIAADDRAAAEAADLLEDTPVTTLSRSGTVRRTLDRMAPATVTVAESRPACEGTAVAEELAADHHVTLHTDAALAHVLAEDEPEAAVVGADTVLADGSVVNKTGTRTAAVAAEAAGLPTYVVTASDKISPEESVALEAGEASALYDGDAPLSVRNLTFDVTPADYVDAVVTERGVLDSAAVAAVAEEHAELGNWE